MKDDLAEAAVTPDLHRFYGLIGWQLAWSPQNKAALAEALQERRRHGLDRMPFDMSLEDATPAQRDVGLTALALSYAAALSRGATDPAELYDVYTIDRPQRDLVQELAVAVRTGRVGSWLDGLAPHTAAYERLSRTYVELTDGPLPERDKIQADGLIKPDETDPRLPAIRDALRDMGYLPAVQFRQVAATDEDEDAYGPDDLQAIKRLQADYRLKIDGVVGPDTLAVINMGPQEKARMLAVAMERLRWLVRRPPPVRIDVNTATAELVYYVDDRPVDHRKVVVGRPGKETPQLETEVFRLVANPTWTVPPSIVRTEMASRGPEYFQARNLRWRGGRLVQQAGPGNALGLVKLDMTDRHQIYLHDTPSKRLFGENQRQRSHGCVRVQGALGFASLLARDEGVEQDWSQARASGPQSFVDLPSRIPVRLIYHDVVVDGQGAIRYGIDPYGWDEPVARALGFGKDREDEFHVQLATGDD
ncbi:MAG: L,D-transpeptidase family protein [Alphaproteobacteria bacterium]|nr:L,D-transpeptidase family protein [Alphaproteobacteria bacterium]